MTLQFGASLTDDTRSFNYDRNMFIIQATAAMYVDAYPGLHGKMLHS